MSRSPRKRGRAQRSGERLAQKVSSYILLIQQTCRAFSLLKLFLYFLSWMFHLSTLSYSLPSINIWICTGIYTFSSMFFTSQRLDRKAECQAEAERKGGGSLVRDSLMLLGKFLCTRFSSAAVSHYIPVRSCLSIKLNDSNQPQSFENILFALSYFHLLAWEKGFFSHPSSFQIQCTLTSSVCWRECCNSR